MKIIKVRYEGDELPELKGKTFTLPPGAAKHAARLRSTDPAEFVTVRSIKGEKRLVYRYKDRNGKEHMFILDRKTSRGMPIELSESKAKKIYRKKMESRYARALDESRKSKNPLPYPTEAWVNNPSRYDVEGFDTGPFTLKESTIRELIRKGALKAAGARKKEA